MASSSDPSGHQVFTGRPVGRTETSPLQGETHRGALRWWPRVGAITMLLMCIGLCPAHRAVAAQPATSPLTVVIKPLTPFVMQDGDAYSGFSIDLWREIARRNEWTFTFRMVDTVTDQIAAVQRG